LFAYTGWVPKSRACVVSFTDGEGIRHSVEVAAGSLYEAVAMGLAEFQRGKFSEAVYGPATMVTVAVKEPEVRHSVPLSKFRAWLASGGKSPNEQVVKKRLRQLLTGD